MEKLWKESFIYQIGVILGSWLQKLTSQSMLIGIFMNESHHEKVESQSIFARAFQRVIAILQQIAAKLKLPHFLENSILVKPMIWLSLTLVLAPFVPTMLVLGMVMVSAFSLFLKMLVTPSFHFRYCRTNLLVILFLFVILIAGFTSVSKEECMKIALLLFAFVFSYFIMINTVENEKQFRFLLYLFVISGTISAIYGLYQYIYGDVFAQAWIDENMFEDIRMRVYSTFENPNVYGEYLILVIPIIIALLWKEKGFIKKLILLGMLGITMLAAVLTFSRGCWLGIMLEIAILLLMIDKRFIFLGIAGLLVLPMVLPDTIMNRFLSIGNMGDSSTSYRVYIWLGTIAMLKDYWFSGVGLGKTSFNAVYPVYSYNEVITPHSHNLFLQLMTEYGVVGLIIFIGIMYQFYKSTMIHFVKEKDILVASLMAGMTGFMLESLFDYTWYNYRVVLLFWMFLSLAMVQSSIGEEKRSLSQKKIENVEETIC